MPQRVSPTQLEQFLASEPYLADHGGSARTDASPFLRLLVEAEREQVTQSFTERHCEPGEIVFLEGEQGDTMYIIWSGRVAILKGSLDSPVVQAYCGAGEIIGEMSLLENQPRSASVVALDHLRLLGINRQAFHNLLENTPSVSFTIMETLSSRLRRSDEARSSGEWSEKRLVSQVAALQNEKQRLEELQRLRQETSELIIHDLRNPLSAIAISIKMLSLVLPVEILQANQDLLEIARTSTARMQRLVDSLLEVSRLETGEVQFYLAPLNLTPLIEDTVQRVSVLERKGICISTQLPPELPPVLADRERIERVLANLMDNALKYTPDNGSITCAAQVDGEFVQVSLVDTGPGIPPEQRERVFERFAQVESQRRARSGFGLGLAYCRLAILKHGGRIWVEDGDRGVGSRFVFTLPITQ
ncbi:MAG: ATP-binding protein [Chloroflexota bacterium]